MSIQCMMGWSNTHLYEFKRYNPENLFRMNTNQFLQTARTITFILQKNKSTIKDFDIWYQKNVVVPWSKDEVMKWAKDSRNIIEKRGDLEINSSLDVSLVFSYLQEEDIQLTVGKEQLLDFGIKKLVRFSQKHLPSGVGDAAAVRIARNWVTTGLSNWELLHALVYVYSRHYETHISLCKHLQVKPSQKLLDPSLSNSIRESAIDPSYLKLRDLKFYGAYHKRASLDPSYKPPVELESKMNGLRSGFQKIDSIETALTHHLDFAGMLFRHDGYHISMLHLFDHNWDVIGQTSAMFADQAEKYIFWRSVGERVRSQKVSSVAWVSELWHRSMKGYPNKPIRNLPITGEGLMVAVLNSKGLFRQGTFEITRDSDGSNPVIASEPVLSDEASNEIPNFFAPVGRGMGGKAKELFDNPAK